MRLNDSNTDYTCFNVKLSNGRNYRSEDWFYCKYREHSCYCSGKVDITYKSTGRSLKSGNISLTHKQCCFRIKHSVASLGGRRAARPGCHHIKMWNHNSTYLWQIPFFLFSPHLHLGRKPTDCWAKTFFFFLVFTYFWTENPLIWQRRPFSFFLVCTYFWNKKGYHHEIPPSLPPPLATPLQALLTFVHFLEYHEVQRLGFEPNNNLNSEQNYHLRSSQCEQAYRH